MPLTSLTRFRRSELANPLLRTLWEKWLLPGFLRREKADILFCPGGVVGTRAPAGCSVVTMFRNMIPFDSALVASMPWGLQRMRNIVLRHVLLRSMAGAELTIFISDHARRLVEGLVRIPKPITIPHGISDAFRSEGQPLLRPHAAPSGRYLLYVSPFDIYKHHSEVVRGFAALPRAQRDGLHLVFLGETNLPGAEPVARLVKQLGLDRQVLILGAVPYGMLPAWYQHAHTIMFASSCENCPNILLESLGAGRPVLSSNVMPMPEFGGPEIQYFDPRVPATLTEVLRQLVTDDDYATTIGNAARRRSLRYDWSQTAAQTWTQIIALVNSKPK